MKGETLSTKGKDFFPNLEKHYWEHWKEYDYLIQGSVQRDAIQVFIMPKPQMKSIINEVSKREKKRRIGF